MLEDSTLKKRKYSSNSLQERIEDIATFSPEDGIAALTELVPGLKMSVSYTGECVVAHEAYSGRANLNRLAKIYLAFGSRCVYENAPLRTRLQHVDLHPAFETLYKDSKDALANTRVAWLFNGFRELREFGVGCGECKGVPAVVIPFGETTHDALYFHEEQYRKLCGDESAAGSMGDWDPVANKSYSRVRAKTEQVREAIARGADVETCRGQT